MTENSACSHPSVAQRFFSTDEAGTFGPGRTPREACCVSHLAASAPMLEALWLSLAQMLADPVLLGMLSYSPHRVSEVPASEQSPQKGKAWLVTTVLQSVKSDRLKHS